MKKQSSLPKAEAPSGKLGGVSWSVEGEVRFTSNRIKAFKTRLKDWELATGIHIEVYDVDPKTIAISTNDITSIFIRYLNSN